MSSPTETNSVPKCPRIQGESTCLSDAASSSDFRHKIKDIILVGYNLQENKFNINRLNNVLSIYCDSKIFRHAIKPGSYDYEELLEYIKVNINIIDIEVDAKERVIISHSNNKQFDLMMNKDSVLTLLGFTDREIAYKGKSSYTATRKPIFDSNKNVLLNLHGTNVDQVQLEFGENSDIDHVLKHFNNPIAIKKLSMSLTDSIDQTYDFNQNYEITFKIQYK